MVSNIEFEDIFILVLVLIGLVVLFLAILLVIVVIRVVVGLIRGVADVINPYSKLNLERPKFFDIEAQFVTATLAGFNVRYQLKVGCELINAAAYRRTRMADNRVRLSLLEKFNQEVVQPFFDENNLFFHLNWRRAAILALNVNPVSIYEAKMDAGQEMIVEQTLTAINNKLRNLPAFSANGCEIKAVDFSLPYPTVDLVRINAAMITEEQRQAILARPEFSRESEKLAIALLEQSLEPDTSGALKDIGRYVEFSKKIAEAEELVIREIQQGPGSESEKQDKIERFKDELRLIRERYQK
jgi:hypothetical protein